MNVELAIDYVGLMGQGVAHGERAALDRMLCGAGGAQAIERGHHAALRTPYARAIWLARVLSSPNRHPISA